MGASLPGAALLFGLAVAIAAGCICVFRDEFLRPQSAFPSFAMLMAVAGTAIAAAFVQFLRVLELWLRAIGAIT